METICKLRVRTYECDTYGHVNNAVYLHYLEAARYEFLRDIGFDYQALVIEGFAIYIARIEIDYVKSARTDDELEIHSRSVKKGAVHGIIEQNILRGDDTIARARVTWATVDHNGRPVRLPAAFDVPGLQPE
jgi:acyl-CoA thioester hydrolase